MTEIKTPRTDAEELEQVPYGKYYVPSSLSRQLERELTLVTQERNELRKKLYLIGSWNGTAKDACDILHEIRRARKTKA